jgi:hypothetical protein
MSVTVQHPLKGGEWMVRSSIPADTFAPEDFNEEQLMIRDL